MPARRFTNSYEGCVKTSWAVPSMRGCCWGSNMKRVYYGILSSIDELDVMINRDIDKWDIDIE
jgi:hypothetical protein